jgi:hypothetical protein
MRSVTTCHALCELVTREKFSAVNGWQNLFPATLQHVSSQGYVTHIQKLLPWNSIFYDMGILSNTVQYTADNT